MLLLYSKSSAIFEDDFVLPPSPLLLFHLSFRDSEPNVKPKGIRKRKKIKGTECILSLPLLFSFHMGLVGDAECGSLGSHLSSLQAVPGSSEDALGKEDTLAGRCGRG